MTDDAPTTSETILARANAETDPKALSNAAVREEPAAPIPATPDPTQLSAFLLHPERLHDPIGHSAL